MVAQSDKSLDSSDEAEIGVSTAEYLALGKEIVSAELRAVLDAMPQIIVASDAFNHIVYLNAAALKYTGRAEGELVGHKWYEQVHPDDVGELIQRWRVGVAQDSSVAFEFRIRGSAEQYRWFELSASPVPLPRGGKFWLAIATDIDSLKRHHDILEEKVLERTAELKRSNRDLAESKNLFESFADNSPVMYLIKDSAGKYRYFNRYAAKFFGWTEADYGKTPAELLTGKLGEEVMAHDRQVLNSGQPLDVIEIGFTKGRDQSRFKCKKFPMEFNGETHVGVVGMDITEHVAMEHAMRDNQELLKLILDSLTDGVLVADCQGKWVLENQACHDMIHAMAVSVGMEEWAEVFQCYHPDEKTLFTLDELPLYRAIRGLSSDDVEMLALNRGESTNRFIRLLISGRPLYDGQNKLVGGLIILRNITAQVETNNKLRSSNAELQRFAYVAAHDLQEPLRTVASYVDLLVRRYSGRLDENADKFISGALDGVHRMQHLVDDLLSLSRVESQARPFEPVDFGQTAALVLKNLSAAITEVGAEVDISDLPVVWGDASQLAQVLQNLLSNALKFRGKEPPVVSISAGREGYLWRFAVKDNGIGIDPQFKDRIFEAFQRLHGQQEYPGTGIGLAICKKIIERHGGKIWLEAGPSQGSTFYFTLPEPAVSQSLNS